MTWPVVVLLVLGAVTLVALVWARLRSDDQPAEADPIFVTGIALTAAGAATIPTLGPMMIGVLAVGLALMGIGISRSRHHPR